MRMTLSEVLDLIGACEPSRRWARKLGKRAFKKAWYTCKNKVWLKFLVKQLQDEMDAGWLLWRR